MPGTIHPNPNDVTPIPASEDRPRRISISGNAKGTVYFGSSVASAHKEVKLDEKNNSVDIAQQAWLVTDSNTVVIEGLSPVKPLDGVAEENFDSDVKVHTAKEPSKKDAEKVASANENQSIPSLTGDETPPAEQPAAVKS